ncbi:YdcF family protein [Bacillus tianshenii]|nr:YdcF family protein [Bacillus tianshenii]
MRRYWKTGFIILIGWFLIHTALIVIDGLNDELKRVDAAVVLGNKVEENGEVSKRLQARLDRAVTLYEDGYFQHIIVSGGMGEEGFDEAKVMKDYLMKKGVADKQILVDSDGYNTALTAENARVIAEQFEFESVVVISQYFHISRTKLAFEKQGFNEVYGAHARYFEMRDLYSIVREFPAYYKYLFLSQ